MSQKRRSYEVNEGEGNQAHDFKMQTESKKNSLSEESGGSQKYRQTNTVEPANLLDDSKVVLLEKPSRSRSIDVVSNHDSTFRSLTRQKTTEPLPTDKPDPVL